MERVAQDVIHRWCASHVRRHALLRIEGLENIPPHGPVLLACRHVHHLYDGCILAGLLPRQVHIFIALDWVSLRIARRMLERACGLIGWPVVLRPTHPRSRDRAEVRESVRRSMRAAVRVLVDEQVLAVFPEGYPNIDPVYTPKQHLDEQISFRPGFAAVVERAEKAFRQPIPVIPVGLEYRRGDRWNITMRCGAPVYCTCHETRAAFVAAVQQRVLELSQPVAD